MEEYCIVHQLIALIMLFCGFRVSNRSREFRAGRVQFLNKYTISCCNVIASIPADQIHSFDSLEVTVVLRFVCVAENKHSLGVVHWEVP